MGIMVASLGRHWPSRKMEWVLAGITFTWGLYFLMHPDIFDGPLTGRPLEGLREMTPTGIAPFLFWGLTTLLVGLLRAIALYINGAHVRTPVVRAIAAFVTMFVFSNVVFATWSTGIANPSIVIYAGLVAADMISAYAAGKDAITAEVHKRIEQGTINDDSRLNRSLVRR